MRWGTSGVRAAVAAAIIVSGSPKLFAAGAEDGSRPGVAAPPRGGVLIVPEAVASSAGPAPAGGEDAGRVPAIEVAYEELPLRADAARVCELFMQRLVARQYDAAFEAVRPYFPISEERFARLTEATKKQQGLAEVQFGTPLGYEFAREEIVKDTVLRVSYIEKYAWDALVWQFLFYKPDTGWILNGVSFDDSFQSLFH